MAEGLPTPKSREQLVSEMVTEYVGITGINDVNLGSVMTQFFDVVARSIARTSGDIFQILRDFSIDRAVGEALNRIGREERIFRGTAQVATGTVQVTDNTFQKIESKIFSGAAAPNIGTTVIRVADASSFPATGRIYIGRGTPNIEGPINYNAVAQVGAFWEVTLDSPTTKFHNISESVIVGQGGTRNVPVNTTVLSPGAGATADVNFNVSSAAILLDGENVNNNVQVVAQEPGSLGNAPAGSVVEFSAAPFPNASVINLVPFTTGTDEESDDDYRDRIKKERLSRGLGTALAVKNAVLGAQASDENARVTSNEIDTTNPEETILYIDNGEGYEEKTEGVGLEFVVDSAIGGEQNFQLSTGGRQTSVAKAFLESAQSAPFDIRSNSKLAILVGGIVSEHTFQEGAFQAEGAATAFEIVASINDNPNLTYEASTSESGAKVVIRAKSEDNDFIQITSPASGVDAAPNLNFASNEINTILLYRDRELLNKDGRVAFVVSKDQFSWSNTITDGDSLIIAIDGTAPVTYTFTNEDFLNEGTTTTVSNQNTLQSWANVVNAKVTGVTAEVNGEQLKLTSNLGSSNRASISIDPASDLVLKGMFSSELGLSAEGNEADFEFSRNTAQIKLNTALKEGQSLNLGSEFTRAEIQSTQILGGQTTIPTTAYVWLVVDDKEVKPVEVGVAAETFLDITKPGGNIIRFESTNLNAFDLVQVNDYVIVWSDELNPANRIEGRVNAVTSNSLDVKLTSTEEAAVVPEGPILFLEGFTVIRSKYAPQKLKIDPGVYNINDIAQIFNSQLANASVSIDNDEIFVFRTNTEATDGALFLADFNDGAKALNLVKNSSSSSINSQKAFYETSFSDRQFPAFVHGKITADNAGDPINSYINTIESSKDLSALGLDPAGFICFSQPYNLTQDILSDECVEIERYIGTTVRVENSLYNKRNRIDDRYHVLNPYDFGHEDILVAVLDDDPTGKTFNIPMFRTAVTNITAPANANNFRAFDQEGGNSEFTEFFSNTFSFDNYKVLMQAKNVIDPQTLANEDAILYRSVEWGRSGEKAGVGYFYPTAPDQDIQHIVTGGELIDIQIFLKSGPVRSTTIDGTTEWDITSTPSGSYDLITYSWNGVGTNPTLTSINVGDYVSILNTGDIDLANQGSYRIDSSTATSFTVRKKAGTFVEQTGAATLQTTTISFFEPADTTAQEIVDYVGLNISDFITAEIIQDNGSSGAGIINKSTGEDSDFSYSYVRLLDGKNYILSSDIQAAAPSPQFVFKKPLSLPTFSTNTVDAYSFNNGEELKVIPLTSVHLEEFLNVLAVTGYSTIGEIKSVERNRRIQFSTNTLGTAGAIQIAGGTATSAVAAVEGSASTLGDQDNEKTLVTINRASSIGLHSDQWVKVFASEVQRKVTNINNLNSIKIDNAVPAVGSSKIEIFNRSLEQRFFGRNRYHTRTRGRTFKVEKQGQFVCISWDGNGTEPYFSKTVDVNGAGSNNISIAYDERTAIADYTVISGDLSFDEVYIGDIATITGFSRDGNNGVFKVLGVSEDGKTLRVRNPNGADSGGNVNEVQTISFDTIPTSGDFLLNFDGQVTNAIPYNAVAGNIETELEGLSNIDDVIVAGDFAAGFTIEFAGVNEFTDVPLLIAQSVTLDSNITIEETTKGSQSGSFAVETSVQEGDTVTIKSDFSILNQGTFRVIRKFENSIYIDNKNAVVEEVVLADQLVTLDSNASTDYDIQKIGYATRLKWAGAGAEPILENARPGDVVNLGTDFAANNQGDFHVVNSGTKLQEITVIRQSRGVDITTGQYGLLNAAEDSTEYYIWYNVDGGGGDPAVVGKTGIEIPITSADTAEDVATIKANVINTFFSADFSAIADGEDVIITTTGFGETTPASNVDVSGQYSVEVTQSGRRNFLDYVNVNSVDESNIVVTDILNIHREAIQFKEYEGVIPGDAFAISDIFLGENNVGSYIVQDVLSDNEIIVTGTTESVSRTLLDANFDKIFIEEDFAYVGYKQIDYISTNPANLNNSNIIFTTGNQFQKISELGGVSIKAIGKMELPTDITKGVDSYKFHTGLIGEANRIVYGEPRDNTTYPGVAAAGAEIFIKAPLVRRVEVSIDVRVKTGVPFSAIVEEVRNSIAALINSNPVGQPIAISNIISNVDAIIGVQAVAISSPQYDAQNDVIRVNAGEKALVLDIIADILVSKID